MTRVRCSKCNRRLNFCVLGALINLMNESQLLFLSPGEKNEKAKFVEVGNVFASRLHDRLAARNEIADFIRRRRVVVVGGSSWSTRRRTGRRNEF